MKYLLDTHALLWWLFDDPKLSPAARGVISDPGNRLLASAASAWEIATKFRLGKLPAARVLVQDIGGWIERAGFVELPVTIVHAHRAGSWGQPHRDPFDRMLAAQSVVENVPIIGCDEALRAFGVTLVW